MLQQILENPAMKEATIEILIMLIGAFIIGVIFGKVLFGGTYEEQSQDTDQKTKRAKLPAKSQAKEDDFRLIEGIGPAIEKLLHESGITTYKDIVKQDVEGLEVILLEGGGKFGRYNPSTWPDQAQLAHEKKWRELEEYQEILNAGKKRK